MSVDGMPLDHFEAGAEYLVGNTLGAFLLADGWAVPIDEPPPTEPAHRAGGGRLSRRQSRPAPSRL